jgi:diguanylate cyclase (GGDEF)-like protein
VYTGGELSVIYGIDSTLAIKKAWVLAIQTAQIMAASLLATILIIFFLLRKTVMLPIFKLKTANARIAKGHYDTLTGIASNDEFGELSSGVHFMAKSIKESNVKIAEMAFKDPLTKLANRRMFNHQLDQSLKNAKRHNEKIAVMFLDLDNFKNINDRLGHSAGDKLIRLFAARILKSTRSNILYPTSPRAGREPSDIVARLGGDEFAVMIGAIDDEVRAGFIAKRIIESMAESFDIENEKIFARCSIGISIFPNNGSDYEELIKAADMAMYDAKEKGKNRHCFFSDELNERLSKRLEIERDLRIGIDEKQFIVHYQPQLTTLTETIYGLEALVRWEHPSKGMISPFDFISIAESSGLIVELGSFVMFEACRAAEAWRKEAKFEGLISVNVSSVQFERDDVYSMIKSALSTTGLPAKYLSIELTESAIMSGSRETITELEKIRSLGVQIALDDFGTGYSSLSYLRTLPVDTIKMDRMFVIGCDKDEEVRSIISAIVKMAHALNLKVVAEGIETESELNFMRKVELDVIQGYFYSKPLPDKQTDLYLTRTQSETT